MRSFVGMAIRAWGRDWRLRVLFSFVAGLLFDPSYSEQEIDFISKI